MFSTRCMTISEVPCSIFDAKPSYYEIVTWHCCKLYVYKQSYNATIIISFSFCSALMVHCMFFLSSGTYIRTKCEGGLQTEV